MEMRQAGGINKEGRRKVAQARDIPPSLPPSPPPSLPTYLFVITVDGDPDLPPLRCLVFGFIDLDGFGVREQEVVAREVGALGAKEGKE